MKYFFSKIRSNWTLTAIYSSNLLLAFHYFLILYVNSSFLEQNFGATNLGTLYIVGSVINLIILLNVSKLLKRFGNYSLILTFIILELVALVGLTYTGFQQDPNLLLVALFFILHQSVLMMILFNLDIFLESASTDESQTGSVRGVYLTLANAALVISPAIAGLILTDGEYWKVYLISSILLVPLFLISAKSFKHHQDSQSAQTKVIEIMIKFFWGNKNIYYIFVAQLLLQFFYVYMIIYMPIHLHENIGFSWSEIGIMFTIILLPFVLLEIPVGKIADKKWGEKEILATGFIIMAVSTLVIPFLTTAHFLIWTITLFLTRIGASFAEITTESYFFKQVNADNADTISFFRVTRPLAFIITPAIAGISFIFISLYGLDYGYVFFVFGAIMLLGLRYILPLEDTK